MEIKKLEGGRVIGVNPDRLQLPLNGDKPRFRVGSPGSVFGNVGTYVLLTECSKRQHGKPEPTRVKAVFREVDGQVLLLVAPVWETADDVDVYEIKFESGSKAPVVRGLKLLFQAAAIALRTDLWYEMETEIVQDATLGYAVAGNWTKAVTRVRAESEKDAAAGQQSDQQDSDE